MHKKANLIEEMPGLGLFCDYIFIKTLLKSCLQTISEVKNDLLVSAVKNQNPFPKCLKVLIKINNHKS